MPVSFVVPNCSAEFDMPGLALDRECTNGTLTVRVVAALDYQQRNWTVLTSTIIPPAGVRFYEHRGGFSAPNFSITTSSNPQDAQNAAR